ncbi:MAG: hypothetical protein CL927_21045 [Deltaproteobacteria bacterium]|nr:hypothetical protein [Deltaproteobacteria bacterium]HCH61182.1 hypothetical protein [Deltaproteobacteria bacterium]
MDGQLMPDVERGTPRIFAGRYQVERMIARGGMGEVYLCTDLDLRRPVALKILRAGIDSEDGGRFIERFRLEARTLATLNHANIVTLYEYGETEEGQLFLALEYIDGPRFTDIARRGPMDPARVMRLGLQICRALRFAHRRGVVHRDLKPSNLLIRVDEDGDEQVKVVDFGLVKVVEDDQALTRAGLILGSPHCMAPEQIRGLKQVDHRADIYAMGVLMFRALVGKWPFHGDTSTATMIAHINQPVPRFGALNPDVVVPAKLEEIVLQCLEKDPAKRPPDVAALMAGLREVTGQPATVTHSNLPGAPSTTEASIITPRVNHASEVMPIQSQGGSSAVTGSLGPQFKWIGMGVGLSLLLMVMVVAAYLVGHSSHGESPMQAQRDALMPMTDVAEPAGEKGEGVPPDGAVKVAASEAPSSGVVESASPGGERHEDARDGDASPVEAEAPQLPAPAKSTPPKAQAKRAQKRAAPPEAAPEPVESAAPTESEVPTDDAGTGAAPEASPAPSKLESPDEVPDVDDIFGQ